MSETKPLPRFAIGPVALVAAVQAVVLTAVSGRYGFHRDELYFLSSGEHLDWSYVDHPPLTPLLAKIAATLFGATPSGLRIVATLIGAAVVVVVALVARELGGDRAAQLLAAAATSVSTYVLVVTHMLSTSTLDLLVWTVIGLLALRLFRAGDARLWVAIGAAIGVGLANKWLVLLLVSVLGVAVLLVGPRSVLRTWWLAGGVAVTTVLALPLVIWQVAHGFPMLTVASGISSHDGLKNRLLFVPQQVTYLLPVLVPVWIAGMVRLWRDPALRWARALPMAYLVLCAALLVLGGKPYYSMPLLLLLVAAGAEPTTRWFATKRPVKRALSGAVVAVSVALSFMIALPLLPPDALGGSPVMAVNREQAEQIGWPGFAANVASVWQRIPPEQRDKAVILARNYGQAGALDRYGAEHGLPRTYSGHMSFADWGPPPDDMTGPVLLIGFTPIPQDGFTGCREMAPHDNGIDLDNREQGTQIALCEATTTAWSELWPTLRRFYVT
ncbi:glycosyltransferase family 39 protein [Allokutzneria sp. A3M-2-11 16]|uniref:ArnT family glycosyltransferase n=1 Tax=Allokutzneria sp. A3M-2-11 16 TaxID=2962043 RepID=UPI0020B88A1F|nr:glycosyltransferase family 39 protein [Allokutzneria sp. A3M-2-11 16]MCP3804649.1 glycosyltransferase family 39 protein [Allokutzneria sp. A3M-2-11 16]